MEIHLIRHAWHEKAGFEISRPTGHKSYTFLHFFNRVEILSNGKKTIASPNACMFYGIGAPQYFYSSRPLVHDWIHFDGDMSRLLEISGIPVNTVFYPATPGFITPIVREMEAEFLSRNPNRELMLQIKTQELFIKLGRSVTASGNTNIFVDSGTSAAVRAVREEMFSSMQKQWKIEDMAKMAGISQSRFYALYNGIYGTSPVDDLIRARIDSAKYMLAYSEKSILEISDELGYANLTHFLRQFKKLTQKTPTQYRNENKQ